MQIYELFLIGIGLSFDTLAVSVSASLIAYNISIKQTLRIALVLTLFQSIMPLLGWFGGIQIEKYFSDYANWIAFGLLSFLGIKLIIDSFKEIEDKKVNLLILSILILAAIATSIDAFFVGISFAFLNTNIILAMSIIGFVTFIVSILGIILGKKIKNKFGKRIEILGGIILIFIGIKILLNF